MPYDFDPRSFSASPDFRLALFEGLTQSLSLPKALQNALRALGGMVPADGVFAEYFDKENRTIHVLAQSSFTEARAMDEKLEVSEALAVSFGYATRARWLKVDAPQEDPFSGCMVPETLASVRSYLMLRLGLLEEKYFGIVCFYSFEASKFSERHAALLETIRNPLSLSLGFELMRRFKNEQEGLLVINRELQTRMETQSERPLTELTERTPSLKSLAVPLRQVAQFDATVLITGESGAGKRVVAGVIHRLSSRHFRPFVRINCATLPENHMESGLFGFEAGALPGAKTRHLGLFEEADGGTILLEEVGALSLEVQAKLLRTLQTGKIRRLGGDEDVSVDVRMIATSSRDLGSMAEKGAFRLDLYYRLNIFPIDIKPLRERTEDIEPLSKAFLKEISVKFKLPRVPSLSPEALDALKDWLWPGNVRELYRVLARAALKGEQVIRTLDFSSPPPPATVSRVEPPQAHNPPEPRERKEVPPKAPQKPGKEEVLSEPALKTPKNDGLLFSGNEPLPTFEAMQRRYFSYVLKMASGKISGSGGAAELTGLHPNTLRSRLAKLGLLK